MAPRRRKKRKQSESMERFKPPLMFVESPVQGQKHYCTPVQAARNPYMAPSIAVDNLTAKWVSPQFPKNETLPMIEETRKRRGRNKMSKDEKERSQQRTKITIPALDFEDKVRSACKETRTRTRLRRSTRLKEKLAKQEHFLFGEGKSLTPKLRNMKVLVPETPECAMIIPVVLRKLREGFEKNEESK